MKKILVTGGTVFVSKYIAEYFSKDNEVYVLNRNTKPQLAGVKLIEADRHNLGDKLKDMRFDLVIDVTAYNESDIADFVPALGSFDTYVMISSSAVYPETGVQPFSEEEERKVNKYWGDYGTNKIAAENKLMELVPNAFIIRPPYLYGPVNNVYREAFVFDCALADRKFYLPGDGQMRLQFFHVKDLCKFISILWDQQPVCRIYNVGNKESITIKQWVDLCYMAAGKVPKHVNVSIDVEQRNYFSFYNYEYALDVTRQLELMPDTEPLFRGFKECFDWYIENSSDVRKKPFIEYIDEKLS